MKAHLSIVLVAAALSACGGGSSSSDAMPPASNEVPASAYASSDAFTSYAASLQTSETGEPVDLGQAVAPTSETAEPKSL